MCQLALFGVKGLKLSYGKRMTKPMQHGKNGQKDPKKRVILIKFKIKLQAE